MSGSPTAIRVAQHVGVGALQGEAKRQREVAFRAGCAPRVVVVNRLRVRRRVAGLRDDAPGAGAKGAEGAERDRPVVQVEVLGGDDVVVVLVLAVAILVGGETTLHSRLVVM